jgi:hypothetical protein
MRDVDRHPGFHEGPAQAFGQAPVVLHDEHSHAEQNALVF